jgi:AcrR family transcriptional regulator
VTLRAPTRSDSRANRARLVQAARELFRERGLACDVKDIAEHAGVGIGTVYRNFASKDDLIAAVADEISAEVAAELASTLSQPDPGRAVNELIDNSLRRAALDGSLLLSMGDAGRRRDGPPPQIVAVLHAIFERAREAGAIRTDVPVDVLFSYMKLHFGMTVELQRKHGKEEAHRMVSGLLRSALQVRD